MKRSEAGAGFPGSSGATAQTHDRQPPRQPGSSARPNRPKPSRQILLNYIDEMDSRVNSVREYVAKDTSDGSWTPYHRLLERHFYKGPGRWFGNRVNRQAFPVE
jgi:hypothetical protein